MFLGLYVFNMVMCFNTCIYVEQKCKVTDDANEAKI